MMFVWIFLADLPLTSRPVRSVSWKMKDNCLPIASAMLMLVDSWLQVIVNEVLPILVQLRSFHSII
jgi:hypothetical protein